MKRILISFLVVAFAVGCAARKPAPTTPEPPKADVEEKSIGGEGQGAAGGAGADGAGGAAGAGGAGGAAGAGGAGAAGGNAAEGGGAVPGKDAASFLAQRSIYFEYDSFTVKDDAKPVLQAHAKFLVDNPTAKVYLQGNTDERGSREYNLALGQKRADAVRKIMLVLGAKDNQIEAVSFGEEKPKAPGHDEAAWAQNRRADIVYQGE